MASLKKVISFDSSIRISELRQLFMVRGALLYAFFMADFTIFEPGLRTLFYIPVALAVPLPAAIALIMGTAGYSWLSLFFSGMNSYQIYLGLVTGTVGGFYAFQRWQSARSRHPTLSELSGRSAWFERWVIRLLIGSWCLSAVGIALKSVPMWEAILWMLLLTLVLWQAGPSWREWRIAQPHAWGTTLLLMVSTLCSIFILEAGLRVILDWRPPAGSVYTTDPELVFQLNPGGEGLYRIPTRNESLREVPVHISSQGLRDREYGPKQPNEYRVAIMGDSLTMGHGMPLEETFVKRLEGRLQDRFPDKTIRVINAGVGGYAPWQMRRFLHDRVLELEPDMVLLQLFLENDVEGMLEQDDQFLETYNVEWKRVLIDFKHLNAWPRRVERWMSRNSAVYSEFKRLTAHRYTLGTLLEELRWIPEQNIPNLPPAAPRSFLVEASLLDNYPRLAEARQRLNDSIQAIYQDCQSHGIEFALFAIPSKFQVINRLWQEQIMQSDRPDMYSRWLPMRELYRLCHRENIPYIDLRKAFEQHRNPESLYFALDAHINQKGADLVAESLDNSVAQRLAAMMDG